jgi:serine/threonine protein kinase
MSKHTPDLSLFKRVDQIGEGRFELHNTLAEGGQAKVWKAKEIPYPQRDLAVKLVVCDVADLDKGEPSYYDIFVEEGSTWAEFQKSPHVVQLYYPITEVFDNNGKDCVALGFAMEFSPEGDLGKYARNPDFSLGGRKQTRNFLLDIAYAIKAGHDKDIVHSDIKARNVILFKQSGSLAPKLMDFGLSISTDTSRSNWGGSPEYMAPEVFRNVRPTKESDVYSLGVLFYEILTGRLPYVLNPKSKEERWNDYEALHNTGSADMKRIVDRFDSSLAELVKRMMAVKPGERMKLPKAIGRLRQLQEDEIRSTIKNPESDAVIRARTYRWNPRVHEFLGNHLFYYLIKGTSPSGDPTWFKNNLTERGIHGYALYRVLGGFDYVLRVWLKHPYDEELDLVMRTFRDSHGGHFIRFAVKQLELYEHADSSLSAADHDVISAILSCRHGNAEIELENLRKQGLVSSMFDANDVLPIRFFLTIHAGSRPSEFLLKSYAREFADAFSNSPARQLSIYQGTGDFSLLVKFRLAKFEDFVKVYDIYQATSSIVRLGEPLTSQTYVEMDQRSLIESDDGSIIAQVNELANSDG